MSQTISTETSRGVRLWIDGVGCWLVWFGDQLALGNGAPSKQDFDRIRIYADLKSRHALLARNDGRWLLEPRGDARINGTPVQQETRLKGGEVIQLGDDVTLSYAVPSPLSQSAVMTLTSGHRTVDSLDGWVLLDQTCLLGPSSQDHIQCRNWEQTVVLFLRDNLLWWREHAPGGKSLPVIANETISGEDWRMRVEELRG